MVLLSANNIKKMFADFLLFDNVSFQISEGDKIGFIGVNGAGKSTLFKILMDEYDYDSGEIVKNKLTKIGYLDQYSCKESEKTVFNEVLEVFDELLKTEQRLDEIRFDIENGADNLDALIAEQNRLNERLAENEGFHFRSKIESCLKGLGFSSGEFNLKVSELSGGQKTRVELAKILLSNSNLLLLDEPTNHLDIESVEWLEGFLSGYKGAYIVISHDRYFLDKVTNKIMELDGARFENYTGNYSAYSEQKAVIRKTEQRNNEKLQREIERLEGVIEQQHRWNREKNIKTAESKQKVVDKLKQEIVEEHKLPENMFYNFRSCGGGGNDVLICENVGMSFGEKQIFKNVDMHIIKGEKVFLLGPNGCGKTTLLKIINNIYEQTCGNVKIGANIKIGYYDQLLENLSEEKTVMDEVWDEFPNLTQTEIRNALAVFLFRGEDVFKLIKSLSGGERARVELTKLMLRPVNFLIMDEPTNHLDIESREALETALSEYDGTMIMVSHDRYFINKLADRIVYLTSDGAESYYGGYDVFSEKMGKKAEAVVNVKEEKINDYKERKRIEAEKRKLINDYKKIETLIGDTEAELEAVQEKLLSPDVATDYVKAAELSAEAEEISKTLEGYYEEWEQLQMQIDEKGIVI